MSVSGAPSGGGRADDRRMSRGSTSLFSRGIGVGSGLELAVAPFNTRLLSFAENTTTQGTPGLSYHFSFFVLETVLYPPN